MILFEFLKKFRTEEKAISYFIQIRYIEEVKCGLCGSYNVSHRKNNIKFFQCNDCNNSFSIFKNTIFEHSKTDFRKWLFAINLFLNGKKGISGYQLKRELGVTYKTAWRMLRQIRLAMSNTRNKEFINTIIEMDETYVGGKPRKGNKKYNKRGRGTSKTPVIGALDRINKQVYAKVALPDNNNKALSGKQLMAVLETVCSSSNIVVTDQFQGYNVLKKSKHIHFQVDHDKMYVDGDIHTNNIESFWSTLKRGILGIYHKVSIKYLQSYINEFCFRYNNRELNMFDLVLEQSVFSS